MTASEYIKKNDEIARKWRALMQRRREYLTDLYRSGRYKRYFTEQALLNQMRETAAATEHWDALIASRAPNVEAPSPVRRPQLVVDVPQQARAA